MTQHEGRRLRLLRAQRASVRPVDETVAGPVSETAETVLPDVPRVGALDALLREVDSLRLTLETDLTLAAAAVESGAVQVAADIIDSDRDGLQGFEKRALGHVADLSAPRKRRLRVQAAPFVAAAAVAGFLLGVVPHTNHSTQTDTISAQDVSASQSLQTLEAAASSGQTAEAIAAAQQLHGQIYAQVIAGGTTDPQAARQALELLNKEREALLQTGVDSAVLNQVLAASRALSSSLLNVINTPATAPARTTRVPSPPVVVAPSPQPTRSPSSKPTPSSSPKPSPTTSPSPKASSSPSSSGAPNGPGGLPGTPH